MDYNCYRLQGGLGYVARAAVAAKCFEQGSAALGFTQDKENGCEMLS